MVSVYKPSSQSIAAVRRVGMTVGSHPSPTAPKGDIKTFPPPPPPTIERTGGYIGVCFQKFPKLSGTKVQNVRTGVLGFLMSGKGVNTRTDNLKVHMAVLIPAQRRSGSLRVRGGWSGVATGVRRSRVSLVVIILLRCVPTP
jgi:hypothetical protein